MSTLYRNYRPKNFTELVGQNHIKTTLQYEIELDRMAHSYLFCGPRGIGKTTIARVFAKAVNCINRKKGEHEPCEKCKSCLEIAKNKSLDIIEIDAASHTGVDNVRENIIAAANVVPNSLKYKIFIIDEVHMLSISAFNALLKILEEPPKNVIFILCTTEAHKIPDTIISRCQRFDFRKISVSDIVKKLSYISNKEEIKVDSKILESIARQSEGHMRDAESIFGQVIAIGGKKITEKEADLVIPRSNLIEVVNLIELLSNKNTQASIEFVNKLVNDGVNLKKFLEDLIEILRKIMLIKVNPVLGDKLGIEYGEHLEIQINKIANKLEIKNIISLLNKFIKIKNEIKNNFIIQLPIEIAIVELCNTQEINKTITPIQTQTKTLPTQTQPIATPHQQINPVQTNNKVINLSIDQIKLKWNEILIKIKKYNHSLSFILRACEPKEINNNTLTVVFKYKFHKERIEEQNIKSIIEKVLFEVYKQKIFITGVIDEKLDLANNNIVQNKNIEISKEELKNNKEDDNIADEVIKNFGGKIIN